MSVHVQHAGCRPSPPTQLLFAAIVAHSLPPSLCCCVLAVHHGRLELPLGPACVHLPGADAVFTLRWACCLGCHVSGYMHCAAADQRSTSSQRMPV